MSRETSGERGRVRTTTMAEFSTITTVPSPPSGDWDSDGDNDDEITLRMNRGPWRIKPLKIGGGVGRDLVNAA